MSNSRICELICTRLSHDIVGNIGAVANAVELLEEGDMDFIDDIKSILSVSSKTLSSRLKFFRMVFGLDNSNLQNNDVVIKTAQDYLLTLGNKDFPITLSFSVTKTDNIKNALLMVMIMGDVLIRGGTIYVEEIGNALISRIDASAKISTDKLEKINQSLTNSCQTADAGLAHIAALCAYNKDKKIELLQDNSYITLCLE